MTLSDSLLLGMVAILALIIKLAPLESTLMLGCTHWIWWLEVIFYWEFHLSAQECELRGYPSFLSCCGKQHG